MKGITAEFDELRLGIERLRRLLETLVVRGLRACGPDELLKLQALTEYLENAGAGHVAAVLSSLHASIEKDQREAARMLLNAQISVRLLERLLTLRVVGEQYHFAIALLGQADADADDPNASDDDEEMA